MSDLRTVTVSGTYYEQGCQHGAALADVIRELVAQYLDRVDWHSERAQKYLRLLEENTHRWAAPLLEELQGIAAGSGVAYEELWAYNCLADLGRVHQFCTNVAFRYTPEGPALGKTNDIGKDAQRNHALFRRTEGEGAPLLLATWPGTIWANCFVTLSGLVFGGANVSQRARCEEGLPSNVLLRWIAEAAKDVEEAVALVQETPIMHHPINITLADAEGHLVVVEKSPKGCAVREPDERGVIFATNHFCSPPLRGTDTPPPELRANSEARFANLQRLTATGPYTVERIQAILADHTTPGAICQHGAGEMWTSVAYVALPRPRTLHFAYGRPCEVPFATFTL
ncbi:MAG TPA: hypothetical protein EYP85_11120 [Armatimonadetes bacterium]|nr:hypothetical protein [Armatimonadota bacterium]